MKLILRLLSHNKKLNFYLNIRTNDVRLSPISSYSLENMIGAIQQGFMTIRNQSSDNVRKALTNLQANASIMEICGDV